MSSRLELLPTLALDLIVFHLASGWRPSLYDFALASKRCCVAANTYRFSQIRLKIISRRRLDRDIQLWDSILQAACSFPHVRELTLEGSMPSEETDSGEMEFLEENGNPGESVDDLTNMNEYNRCYTGNTDIVGTSPSENQIWEPLSQLLRRLTGLKDLVYACSNQFPPPLLDALHQCLPRCKLHLRLFRLRSLVIDADSPRCVDDYEYALATSPNLHSAFLRAYTWDDEGRRDCNEGAVMCMATGLASSLANVYVREPPFGASLALDNVLGRHPPPWQGFFLDKPLDSYPRGRIHTLSLDPACIDQFLRWESHLDLSVMRTLQLWQVGRDTVARAARCSFPVLTTLLLDLHTRDLSETPEQMDEAGGVFLLGLCPLRQLGLSGYVGQHSFQAVLDHHAGSVRKLALLPLLDRREELPFYMTPERINMIRMHCLNMTDLRLRISRTKGDSTEVDIYRALGTLPCLRDLSVQFDCSRRSEPPETWDLNTPKADEDILINIAVDEPLARAIFGVIIADGSPLERLKLEVGDTYHVYLEDFREIMGQKWLCVRVPGRSTAASDKILVQECGVQRRKQLERDGEWKNLNPDEFLSLFHRVWPETTGDWKRDWHSFPLSLDG